jgi:ATP-dependent helicase/nuclease subunit A
MFEEQEGFVIVDLKTDNIKESEIASRSDLYRDQLDIYAYALKQVGVKVKDKVLYFVRLDKGVVVKL